MSAPAFRFGDLRRRNHSLVESGHAFSGTGGQHQPSPTPDRARGSRARQALRPARGRCARSHRLWRRILCAGRPQWLRPDAGSITIDGIDALADPVAAKQITAWLSDEPMIYDKLTPFEYLEFVAGLWRIEAKPAEARARELIGWLGLEPHAHERCEGFSRGMRQKVALAGALVHNPKLIILCLLYTS